MTAVLDELLVMLDELTIEELDEATDELDDARDELLTTLEELAITRIELATDDTLEVLLELLMATELDVDDFELDELDAGELLTAALDVAAELAVLPPPPPPHALRVKLSADKAAS